MIDRRGFGRLAVAGLAASALQYGPAAAQATKTVLFVCQYGSVKSSIAREVFRARAAALGVGVSAISRGITPQDHISPALLEHLRADGIDPKRDPLRKLDQDVLSAADIVVLFDTLPADLVRKDALDWSAMPSMNQSYDQARAFLDPRIDALLTTLRGH